MIALTLAPLALAQEAPLDADLLQPSVASLHGLVVEDARPTPGAGARASLSWAHESLRYVQGDTTTSLMAEALTLHPSAWWGGERLRLGATAPVVLLTSGELAGLRGPLMGDPSLDGRALLLPEGPLGLAALGRLTLPLGASERQLGLPGPSAELGLALDHAAGPWWLGLNLAGRLNPEVDLGYAALDDALLLRAGAAWRHPSGAGLSAELLGQLDPRALGDDPTGAGGEVLASGWREGREGVVFRLGAGTGFGPGAGVPRLRVVAGVEIRAPQGD